MTFTSRFSRYARAAVIGTAVLVALAPAGAAQAQTSPTLTVNRTATFDQAGAATVTGSYDCGNTSGSAFIEVNLAQPVGRVSTVTGAAFAEIAECTPGATGTWSATIVPSNGKFRGGQATANARLVIGDSAVETRATVRLRG